MHVISGCYNAITEFNVASEEGCLELAPINAACTAVDDPWPNWLKCDIFEEINKQPVCDIVLAW